MLLTRDSKGRFTKTTKTTKTRAPKPKAPKDKDTKNIAISLVLDHSGSMGSHQVNALLMVNKFIDTYKQESTTNDLPTLLNIVKFGTDKRIEVGDVYPVGAHSHITNYGVHGNTPLFDAVLQAAASLESSDSKRSLSSYRGN